MCPINVLTSSPVQYSLAIPRGQRHAGVRNATASGVDMPPAREGGHWRHFPWRALPPGSPARLTCRRLSEKEPEALKGGLGVGATSAHGWFWRGGGGQQASWRKSAQTGAVRAPSPTTQALRRGGSSAVPGTGVASGRHEQRPLEGPLVPPRHAASRACEIRTLSSQACRCPRR